MIVTMIMAAVMLLAVAITVIAIDRSSVLLKYRGEKSNKPKLKKSSIALKGISRFVITLLLVPIGISILYLFITMLCEG